MMARMKKGKTFVLVKVIIFVPVVTLTQRVTTTTTNRPAGVDFVCVIYVDCPSCVPALSRSYVDMYRDHISVINHFSLFFFSASPSFLFEIHLIRSYHNQMALNKK